jgi:protein-tyrosine phosphatase
LNAQRFWRGFGVVIATMLLGAAAAAALSLSEPDGYKATARAVHGQGGRADEALAERPGIARAALTRAGAVRTSAAALLENSDVRAEGAGTVAFTVRTGAADAASRVATAYARAYRSALTPGDRANTRVEPAGPAERARRPAAAAPVGAGIGLLAGLLLALALDALARRGGARSEEPDAEAEPERDIVSAAVPGQSRNGAPRDDPAACPLIDLHCHILPGIDDGPRSFAESVALARLLAEGGVQVVAATPHVREDHPGVVPEELEGRCADLQERLDGEEVPLRVVPGGEVDLRWALSASFDELRLVSYAQRGTDLLLETPYSALPSSFEDQLFELSASGFRVLLAHPERNYTFQDDPDRLADLVARGTLVQVTAQSLVRTRRRSRSARLARHLVAHGLAHVLASDSHAPRGLARASMRAAVEAAPGIDRARASWMASDAPAAILSGESLPLPPPLRRRALRDRLRL